jgi:hypothetical protein
LLSVAERISPRLVDLQQLRQGFEGQKSDRPKPVDAPSNLYRPVEDDGGVRGDFSDGARRSSMYQSLEAHPAAAALAAAALLGWGALALRRRGDAAGAAVALLGAGTLVFTGKGTLAAAYKG